MRVTRRQVVQGIGAVGLGLAVGCGTWPGQAPPRIPTVGYLGNNPASSGEPDALRQGLAALGYVEGQTIHVEFRHADAATERLAVLAAELLKYSPDVLVA